MKAAIYYFSGTGNSLKVAKDIAEGLGDTAIISIGEASDAPPAEAEGFLNDSVLPGRMQAHSSADLSRRIPCRGIKKDTGAGADKVGFVFPVYMCGMPLLVVEFIKKLQGLKEKYVFSVVTHGGNPGATNVQFKDLIKQSGGLLSAGFVVKMPGNYVVMYGAKPPQSQAKLFENAKAKIAEIVRAVKNNESGILEKSNVFLNMLGGIFYKITMPRIHGMDAKFWAQDTCNACGICAKICPVENISIENGKPVWHHKCEQCMACIQWCPVTAIQYGKNTVGRPRYHNPDIKLQELMK